jgi:hypothetical protein
MILNKFQAEAAYSSMCALNNVGGTAKLEMLSNGKYIEVDATGENIIVRRTNSGKPDGSEIHLNQASFAAAYGLQ